MALGLVYTAGPSLISTKREVFFAFDCPMDSLSLLCESNQASSWLKTLGILFLNHEFSQNVKAGFRHFTLISHFVVQAKSFRNYSNLKPNQVEID